MKELWQAVRALKRAPAYSLSVICLLSVCGALSLSTLLTINRFLSAQLPFVQADQLYFPNGIRGALSMVEARDWRDRIQGAELAIFQNPFVIGSTRDLVPAPVTAAAIDNKFLDALGIQPSMGGFADADFDGPGARRSVLISHRFWKSQFGRDSSIIGKEFTLAGSADRVGRRIPGFLVIGVLPADFMFPTIGPAPDLLFPLAGSPTDEANSNWSAATFLVRVSASSNPGAVAQQITTLAQHAKRLRPTARDPNPTVELRPVDAVLMAPFRPYARVAFVSVVVLTLLGAVSFGGLAIARQRDKAKDARIRLALGATRSAFIRLSAYEAAPLVIFGALGAVILGAILLGSVRHLLPQNAPLQPDGIGSRAIAYAALTAAITFMVVVALTSWRASTPTALAARKPRARLGSVIIASQLAISFVTTLGGTLLVATLYRAWQVESGFNADNALLLEIDLTAVSPQARRQMVQSILGNVGLAPGDAAGVIEAPFLTPRGALLSPAIRRPAGSRSGDEHAVPFSGDIFSALGVSLVRGRLPTLEETTGIAPIVVVSRKAAANLWPESDAVGQVLTSADGRRVETVVGVVEDGRYGGISQPSDGQIYRPSFGSPRPTLIVRARSSRRVKEHLVQVVKAAHPEAGIVRIETVEAALGHSVKSRAFRAALFGGFAAGSLLVSVLAIVGVSAMAIAARTKEFAVRYALGSTRRELLALLAREQAVTIVIGLAAGALASVWSVRLLKAFLFGADPYSRWFWLATAGIIASAALIGFLLPALKASETNPASALRFAGREM